MTMTKKTLPWWDSRNLHLILDFETQATTPDAVVWAYSCVGVICKYMEFYTHGILSIAATHAQSSHGRERNEETIQWCNQNVPPLEHWPTVSTIAMLEELYQMAAHTEPARCYLWSYGATFDIPILHSLERMYIPKTAPSLGRHVPYRHQLCLRTLQQAFNLDWPEIGQKHNPLDDCRAEAAMLIEAAQISRRIYEVGCDEEM